MMSSAFSIFFWKVGSKGVSRYVLLGPSRRKTSSPSLVRRRLTTSFGSTSPSEFPTLRTLSATISHLDVTRTGLSTKALRNNCTRAKDVTTLVITELLRRLADVGIPRRITARTAGGFAKLPAMPCHLWQSNAFPCHYFANIGKISHNNGRVDFRATLKVMTHQNVP